jgi:alkylation response protein AidB-like acyl-CoA dehydrogenase
MGWDFSTDAEFQRELHWMAEFVRDEIWPLETVAEELGSDGLEAALAPLRARVKESGLWAAHLPAELGGQGFGQVKLGLMHEILGTSPLAPSAFGNQAPDSGNSEILALAGTPEQKERYLHHLLAGDLRSGFSMTEPDSAGSDPTLLQTLAVRDGDSWVINGHKWYTTNGSRANFFIVMALSDPGARPHRRASMFLVDRDAPGVTVVRDIPIHGGTPSRPTDSSARTPRSATTVSGCRPRRCSGRRVRASSSLSTGWDRGASTTACGGWAFVAVPSTCSASARPIAWRMARHSASTRRSRIGSRTRAPSCRRRAS